MNRSTFLRRFAGGIVALVAAPTILEPKAPLGEKMSEADKVAFLEELDGLSYDRIMRAAERIADAYRHAHVRRGGRDIVAHPSVVIVRNHGIYVTFRADERPIYSLATISTRAPIGQHPNVIVRQVKYQMLKSIEDFYRLVG